MKNKVILIKNPIVAQILETEKGWIAQASICGANYIIENNNGEMTITTKSPEFKHLSVFKNLLDVALKQHALDLVHRIEVKNTAPFPMPFFEVNTMNALPTMLSKIKFLDNNPWVVSAYFNSKLDLVDLKSLKFCDILKLETVTANKLEGFNTSTKVDEADVVWEVVRGTKDTPLKMVGNLNGVVVEMYYDRDGIVIKKDGLESREALNTTN